MGIEVRPNVWGEWGVTARYDTFVTKSPENRDMFIDFKHYLLDKDSIVEGEIGRITFMANYPRQNSESKTDPSYDFFVSNFYPFGTKPEKDFPYLLGKGIADVVELYAARHLLSQFGSSSSVVHNDVLPDRESQMNRLKIEKNKVYGLDEYVAVLESNVVVL